MMKEKSILKRKMPVIDTCFVIYAKCVDKLYASVKNKFHFLLLFSFLYVVLLLLTSDAAYYANDNIGILRNLEQGSETPMFAVLLGRFLSFLYLCVNSNIAWHGIFLYGIHIVSISLFLFTIIQLSEIKYYTFPFILLYLTIYATFIIRVGYNAASIMIGANSLFALLVLLRNENYINNIRIFLLGLFFALSYLIRLHAVEAVFAFSFPVVALTLMTHCKKTRLRYYILFLLPVIIFIALNLFATKYFVSEQYRHFTEFNKIRGKFHGFPVADANRNNTKLLEMNRWSTNDYNSLTSWFYIDERKFNKRTLNNIFLHPVNSSYHLFNNLRFFYKEYKNCIHISILLLLPGIALSRPTNLLMILIYGLYALFGMIYMKVFYRFPDRIGIPIFLLFFTNIAYLLSFNSDKRKDINKHIRKTSIMTLYLIITALLIFGCLSKLNHMKHNIARHQDIFKRSINVIESFPNDAFFVAEPAAGIHWEYMHPLTTKKSYKVNFIPLGWNIFSPIFYKLLNNVGISKGYELLPTMIDNDKAFFVIQSSGFIEMIKQFARENLGIECKYEKVEQLPEGRFIYRLISK